LPGTSCGLTRDLGRAAPGCGGPRPSLFDLAPGGVYLAGRSPGRRWALTPPFHRCRGRCGRGCVLSVALSFGSPRLGVTQRPALWSPDFPQAASRPRPSDRLALRVYPRRPAREDVGAPPPDVSLQRVSDSANAARPQRPTRLVRPTSALPSPLLRGGARPARSVGEGHAFRLSCVHLF